MRAICFFIVGLLICTFIFGITGFQDCNRILFEGETVDIQSTIECIFSNECEFQLPTKEEGIHSSNVSPKGNGGGIYGEWREDENELPYFFYTFDEITSPYSSWPNTEQIPPMNVTRKDHFFFFGNDRLNIKGVDDGYVEMYSNDRGATWLNYFEPNYENYAGGFSYLVFENENITNNNDIFNSAYLFGKRGNLRWERKFGIGYYNITLFIPISEINPNSVINNLDDEGGIVLERSIVAPFGNNSFVIDEVFIINNSSMKIENITHYEFWDINRWQLRLEWPRTGYFAPPGDDLRRSLNSKFTQEIFAYNTSSGVLYSQMQFNGEPPKSADEPSEVDYYPPYIFLVNLIGEVESLFLNQTSFLGDGNITYPDAILNRNTMNGESGYYTSDSENQNAMMCMKSPSFSLQPNQQQHFRYAYGYLDSTQQSNLPVNQRIEEMVSSYKTPLISAYQMTGANWRSKAAYFQVPENSTIRSIVSSDVVNLIIRELKWRSCQLQSSSVFHSYYNKLVIPQGSEYLYLSGGDGAPRDQALSLAGNILLNPFLSRETLELIMQIRDAKTGALWYSFAGYGMVSSALGLHKFPSDLDIFFFFAISEYLSITGDWQFLHKHVPFYPKTSTDLPPGATGTTVLDHIRAAFTHLRDAVGVGSHGLIKVREGDWDDGISFTDPDPLAILFTIESGESVPNSQMALYILPILSSLLKPFDESLCTSLNSFAFSLRSPVLNAYTNSWFGRAWLRNRDDIPYYYGNGYIGESMDKYTFIDLESQPWGLLLNNDIINGDQKSKIVDQIQQQLDSPIGPRQQPQTGFVWPAVSQLLTWALSYNGWTAEAWDNFAKHLYATHADVFPDNWVGVWSGPDGWVPNIEPNTTVNGYAGGTWYSIVTPMTDFPVTNSNPDGMFVFSLTRTIGVQPYAMVVDKITGDVMSGVLVNCTQAGGYFSVSFPVLEIDYTPSGIQMKYNAFNDGNINFFIVIPYGANNLVCTFANDPISCNIFGVYAIFSFSFAKHESILFSLSWE